MKPTFASSIVGWFPSIVALHPAEYTGHGSRYVAGISPHFSPHRPSIGGPHVHLHGVVAEHHRAAFPSGRSAVLSRYSLLRTESRHTARHTRRPPRRQTSRVEATGSMLGAVARIHRPVLLSRVLGTRARRHLATKELFARPSETGDPGTSSRGGEGSRGSDQRKRVAVHRQDAPHPKQAMSGNAALRSTGTSRNQRAR